ncbi:endonuclease/exonuclease/phosphatase family protein [Marinospirillum insulare]|uniref:Endonuclease/exonuclease/phosphatase domain-containing protein n=1 Tax=Marinospirillum insulare TaxID=217169 RepID=A0ABQ5ZYS2_9GAMM|nr:endonuclease/exonuclease/phosphatase family protein [Marinospirillum insulare]GLR63811.1 hypothetical protein GCM10007878_12470 [Marinospirillum insulare]
MIKTLVNQLVSPKKLALLLFFCVFSLPLSTLAHDLVVGSWNIQRLGQGQHKNYPALATIASKLDLLAVQEVMTEEGIQLLETELEKLTGEPWGRLTSHAVGSRTYKEMYAFLWRESAVEYLDGAVLYLDRENNFIREPFSAKFKSRRTHKELALGTVHILYGKGIKDRTPEIKALADYWHWLKEIYPNTSLALMGDFNLAPSNKAWDLLKQQAYPLITQGATTLSSKDATFANLYDNIWVEEGTQFVISDAGIIDFPKLLKLNHKKSRKQVSDHAPIYMTLGNATIDLAPQLILQDLTPSTGKVRGNKNSKIYHRPDCCYSEVP